MALSSAPSAARDIEAASRNVYAARAKYATAPALKKLLEVLAAEEDKHYQLLHGLLQFIAGDGEEEIYDMEITNFWVCRMSFCGSAVDVNQSVTAGGGGSCAAFHRFFQSVGRLEVISS